MPFLLLWHPQSTGTPPPEPEPEPTTPSLEGGGVVGRHRIEYLKRMRDEDDDVLAAALAFLTQVRH